MNLIKTFFFFFLLILSCLTQMSKAESYVYGGPKIIYFDVEDYNLDPMFDNNLSKVINLLNENPDLKLQLNGHTDYLESEAIKDDPENKELINLGNYRSKSVRDYLIKNGISSDRLTSQDLGSAQPASRGTSPFSLAKNRRVAFIVLK